MNCMFVIRLLFFRYCAAAASNFIHDDCPVTLPNDDHVRNHGHSLIQRVFGKGLHARSSHDVLLPQVGSTQRAANQVSTGSENASSDKVILVANATPSIGPVTLNDNSLPEGPNTSESLSRAHELDLPSVNNTPNQDAATLAVTAGAQDAHGNESMPMEEMLQEHPIVEATGAHADPTVASGASADAPSLNASNASTPTDKHAKAGKSHGTKMHHSIFHLRFQQLDRQAFWFVFSAMLAFTILVDRLEAWANHYARNSHSEQMFLTRVNAELMMFGFVGLFMFLVKNFKDLPEDQEILVEFVDILCSMGACGVIAIAATLFLLRNVNRRRWTSLEDVNLDGQAIERTGQLEINSVLKYLSPGGLQPMDYQLMAKRFKFGHSLPDDFLYSSYLNRALVQNACDLMDIHWICWVIMLASTVMMFFIRMFRHSRDTPVFHVAKWTLFNWASLLEFCALYCWVNSAHWELTKCLRQYEEELKKKGMTMNDTLEDVPEHPMNSYWSRYFKFALQMVSLGNSFLISFYVMHMHYNLKALGFHWMWMPFLQVPLLIGLFVMLPIIITKFTEVESFFAPDGNSIDATLQKLYQGKDDVEFIRRMWKAKGEPSCEDFIPEDEGVDEKGFAEVLGSMDIHLSDARLHRVFEVFDSDRSGTVTREELMTRLNEIMSEKPINFVEAQTTKA